MNKLLNSIFEYSKVSNENYQPESRDKCVWTRERSYHQQLWPDRKMISNLTFAIEDDIWPSLLPMEMRRVFDNLILNAVSHNDKGINMEVGLKKKHDGQVFSGRPGDRILAEDQKRILIPFQNWMPQGRVPRFGSWTCYCEKDCWISQGQCENIRGLLRDTQRL